MYTKQFKTFPDGLTPKEPRWDWCLQMLESSSPVSELLSGYFKSPAATQSGSFTSWSVWNHPSIHPSLPSQMCPWPSGGGRPAAPGHRALCPPPPGPAGPSANAAPAARRPDRLSGPWWGRKRWSGPLGGWAATPPASRPRGGCGSGGGTDGTALCRVEAGLPPTSSALCPGTTARFTGKSYKCAL